MTGETKRSVTAAYKEYAEALVNLLNELDVADQELDKAKAKAKEKKLEIENKIRKCRQAIDTGTFQTNIFDTETDDFE